ncbi:Transcription-repair-coupling factor [Streptomyces antimycoticus]
MYVAMKDLEIRGAGNLLGGEQSGHIAGVGFDLYVRMVGEAVADYRASIEERDGEAEEAPLEVKIELPVDAHVPHDYAPGERLHLQAYRAIASATSEDDIRAVREELTDRYGKLPEPVENLLLVAGLRLLARACGVTDITLQGSNIRFAPVELRESQELRLGRLYPKRGDQTGHQAGPGPPPRNRPNRRKAAGGAGAAGMDGRVPDVDSRVVRVRLDHLSSRRRRRGRAGRGVDRGDRYPAAPHTHGGAAEPGLGLRRCVRRGGGGVPGSADYRRRQTSRCTMARCEIEIIG